MRTSRSQLVKISYIRKVMGYLRCLELSFKKKKSACLGKTKQTKTNNHHHQKKIYQKVNSSEWRTGSQ